MSVANGCALGSQVAFWTGSHSYVVGEVVHAPVGRVQVEGRAFVRFDDGQVRYLDTDLLTIVPDPLVTSTWDIDPTKVLKPPGVGFAALLREYRDRRRLAQSRLAEAADFDHSYVSRLESGSRMPTRNAVVKLAAAMGLSDGERDALLAAAGFMPGDINNLFANEPVLCRALGLLGDRAVPAAVRDDVRQMIELMVRQARRAAVGA